MPDTPKPSSTDDAAEPSGFDSIARKVGEELRRPAPAGGARVIEDRRKRQVRSRALTAAGVGVLLIAGIAGLALNRDDGSVPAHEPQATMETATANSEPSPGGTEPADSSTSSSTTTSSSTSTSTTTTTTTPTTQATTVAPVSIAPGPPPIERFVSELPRPTPVEQVASHQVVAPTSEILLGFESDDTFVAESGPFLVRRSLADGSEISRAETSSSTNTFQVGRPLSAFGDTWTMRARQLLRVDIETGTETVIDFPNDALDNTGYLSDVTSSATRVWTLDHETPANSMAIGIDPETNTIVDHVPVGRAARTLSYGSDSLWVSHAGTGARKGAISRHDPGSGEQLADIELPFNPTALVARDEVVWIIGQRPYVTVDSAPWVAARIDPATNWLVAIIEIGAGTQPALSSIFELAATDDFVWVCAGPGLVKIDVATDTVVAIYATSQCGGVTATDREVWFTNFWTSTLYRIALDEG